MIKLDQRHFKCPFCGSLDIEIEIDPYEYTADDPEVSISCLDCNQQPHVSQYSYSLAEFEQIFKERNAG